MNIIGLLLAAGIGSRVGSNIPKQYIEVLGKPVLCYTMEEFENNNQISKYYVVCAPEWKERVCSISKEFGLVKFGGCINGGDTGLDSIKNGYLFLKSIFSDDDIVVIQDGNRCLTSQSIIDDGIRVCSEYGDAISGLQQVNSQVYYDGERQSLIDRDMVLELHRPEFMKLSRLDYVFELLRTHHFTSPNPVSILLENGDSIHTCEGNSLNFKITFQEDLQLLEALLSK